MVRFLRKYPVKFYRQRVVDHFVTDFYCSKAKLVIELDGGQHFQAEQKAYDAERTRVLELYGLMVLRFSNGDSEKNFEGVCKEIDAVVRKRLAGP